MFQRLRLAMFTVAALVLNACGPAEQPVATATAPPAPAADSQDCHLTMGWDPWEPYHYRDIGGEVRGLDVELVTAIAMEAGCTLRFDQEDWATLLGRLREGEIDLLSGATRTARRESFAWFTEPYRTESFRLYVRTGDSARLAGETLEELLEGDVKIGTTLDYVYGDLVASLEDDPRFASKFHGVAIGEINYQKLVDFQIDGFLEDSFVAASVIRKKGLGEQIVQHPVDVRTGGVHLMLSRASVDAETVALLNQALQNVKNSGEYDRIIQRYLN